MSEVDRLTKSWTKVLERAASDAAFRKLALTNAAEAFAQVGHAPAAGVEIRIVESGATEARAGEIVLVLPAAEKAAEVEAAALESVAAGMARGGAVAMVCGNPQTRTLTDCGNTATNHTLPRCSTTTTDW